MYWEAVYPNGRRKALTFSYDDGQIHDRRLVDIFNRNGMKATFHLNSGTLGTPGFLEGGEIAELFRGHEIAIHGVRHETPPQLPRERMIAEFWEDRRSLERLAGYPVRGCSYAFGAYSEETMAALSALGVEYSRTVESTRGFSVPANPLRWQPSAHHGADVAALAERFLAPAGSHRLPLLYIWGHSFEFDRENNWELIEGFCESLANRPEIWYVTNIDYIRYLAAMRALVSSVDGDLLYNPSALSVWVEAEGGLLEVKPGETVAL